MPTNRTLRPTTLTDLKLTLDGTSLATRLALEVRHKQTRTLVRRFEGGPRIIDDVSVFLDGLQEIRGSLDIVVDWSPNDRRLSPCPFEMPEHRV